MLIGRPGAGRSAAALAAHRRPPPASCSRSWRWTPPPALGTMPEAVNDPIAVMLWGITPQRLQEWARREDGAPTSCAAPPASPGGRGHRRGSARASTRSPTCATARSSSARSRRRRGRRSSPNQGHRHRHRRRHVARGDRLPRVRPARGRRHGPRDGADPHGPAHPRRRQRRAWSRSSTGTGRPRDGTPHTRPLDGLRAADTPRFGGKSTSLGELLAAGIPVPPGFALSTSAFQAF